MANRTFSYRVWDDYICIDDRFESGKKYKLQAQTLRLSDNNHPTVSWAPLLVIPINERVIASEAKELAEELCKMLTAQWVKGVLGG